MPPATQALIIANVAAFLLELSGGMRFFELFALQPGSDFQPWQLVTYGFLHDPSGFAHIFFNMFALYMFGSDIERLFGSRFYLAYYLVSVIVAGVCHLVVTSVIGAQATPMVGASGGVYGLLLAFGWYFPQRRVMLLIPPIPMQARTFVIVFGVIEFVFGITGTQAGVAHFAHLGGMLGGWLMIEYRRRSFTRR
ncbi:MAG TPA: rhomboid family intramembrane serine protease [Burkholderiales bacterium]|nr:rhomboid family intramembrane serine protease [Burkholderiales bacterium]